MGRENVHQPPSFLQGRLFSANHHALRRDYCIDLIPRSSTYSSAFYPNLLKQYPLYANFGVVHADGNVFCSAQPLSGRANLADRAYVRRTVETRDFAIGGCQK